MPTILDIMSTFFDVQLDLTFFAFLGMAILGILAVYHCIRIYWKIRSWDYLILGYFFFFFIFRGLFMIWVTYLTNCVHYWVVQDDRYWGCRVGLLIWDFLLMTSVLALLLHTIRIRGWKNWSITIKGLSVILVAEIVYQIILLFLFDITAVLTHDWNLWTIEGSHVSMNYSSYWYLDLWSNFSLFEVLLSTGIALYLPDFLVYVLIVYAYTTLKSESTTSSIKWARITWIIFGCLHVFTQVLNFIVVEVIRDPTSSLVWGMEIWLSMWDMMSYANLLGMLAIMFVIIFIPESLLITKYQLFQASKLHTLIEREATKADKISIYNLDTEAKLANYLNNLPPEIIAQLKKAKGP